MELWKFRNTIINYANNHKIKTRTLLEQALHIKTTDDFWEDIKNEIKE